MARDLKQSKTGRNKQRREQKRLERENDRIKAELDYIGQRPTHINLLKYKLWKECQHTCPYTGKEISVSELFSGNVQIEHIHPWSRSLNDSFMNKTLCFADENRAKGDQTPYEFYSKQGEEKWELVKTRALKLFYDTKDHPNRYKKFKRFVATKLDEDFISRQLNDTRFISKEAKNYMGLICDDVQISPGQATATLRHHWGLNNILNLEDDSKSRDDHRHHAVDALVMACTKRSYLQELSKWNRYNRNHELKEFPMPWDGFRADAEKSIAQILVSHKKRKNIITVRNHTVKINGVKYTNKGVAARDQLHKETVFGKRQSPHCLESHFHVRKPISSLTTRKQVNKVVDPFIRKLIHQRVEEIGGYEKEKNVPKGAFFDENGIPQIYLPNKNGEPVPVKKVRMKETIGGAEKLKDNVNQWVNPRNNHHVLIYKDEEGKLKEDVVTFWTVVERKKQGEPTFKLPAGGVAIETTLQINDMFLLGLNEEDIDWDNPNKDKLRECLFRVQSVSNMYYEFKWATETRSQLKKPPYYHRVQSFGKWEMLSPIKVKLSSSGEISKL